MIDLLCVLLLNCVMQHRLVTVSTQNLRPVMREEVRFFGGI